MKAISDIPVFDQMIKGKDHIDKETFDDAWDDVVEAFKLYRMRHRYRMVELFEALEADEPLEVLGDESGRAETFDWKDMSNMDLETLIEVDSSNSATLNHPYAFFVTAVYAPKPCAYPFARPGGSDADHTVKETLEAQRLAKLLLQHLGRENATMSELLQLGRVFRCDACPLDFSGPRTWTELVGRPCCERLAKLPLTLLLYVDQIGLPLLRAPFR